jgi:hypothetical protein
MGKRDFHFFVVRVSAWVAVLKIGSREWGIGNWDLGFGEASFHPVVVCGST